MNVQLKITKMVHFVVYACVPAKLLQSCSIVQPCGLQPARLLCPFVVYILYTHTHTHTQMSALVPPHATPSDLPSSGLLVFYFLFFCSMDLITYNILCNLLIFYTYFSLCKLHKDRDFCLFCLFLWFTEIV